MELVPPPTAAQEQARKDDVAAELERQRKAMQDHLEKTGGYFHPTSVFGMTTSPGLTIRDWFAGMLASALIQVPGFRMDTTPDQLAFHSFLLADAMIKARKAVTRE